ncbi:hypothetical protein LguiA_012025 [Lonicera macranthoides]
MAAYDSFDGFCTLLLVLKIGEMQNSDNYHDCARPQRSFGIATVNLLKYEFTQTMNTKKCTPISKSNNFE